jgi:hypothetical protein
MEHYLGVKVVIPGNFCSPLRQDNSPTCSFKWTNGRLRMIDWAGHFYGDCFDVVMHMYSCTLFQACLAVVDDFGLKNVFDFPANDPKISRFKFDGTRKTEDSPRETEGKKIGITKRKWNKADANFWKPFGLTSEVLGVYQVYPLKHVWLDDRIIYDYQELDPAYGYYFKKGRWKIYFPKRKSFRFISNDPTLQGTVQLKYESNILVITKSLKDVMVLSQHGIEAVAPHAESAILTEKQFEYFDSKYDKIVSLYDFDATGIRGANKMKKLYGIKPCFLTNGRFGSKDYKAKDISDYQKFNGLDETKRLIDETIFR